MPNNGEKALELCFGSSLPKEHSFGTCIFTPHWAEQRHRTPCCELLHVLSGALDLEIGRKRYRAYPGDTLAIPARALHRDCFDVQQGLTVYLIFFSWRAEAAFFRRVANEDLLALPPLRKRGLARIFHSLQYDLGGDSAADRLVVRSRLLTLLLLMLRDTSARRLPRQAATYGQRRREDLFRRAQAYLQEHYRECIGLEQIAKALGTSPYHLSHVFSQQADFSLFDYLTRLRLARARELLRAGRLNVSEVARAVGYQSANYFAKVFRRNFGMAPSEMALR
ncbi:MAG: AraC family transcriptional regulator [Planctomycetota bacterium]|nr:AraC family transcriptional regulator [Planctomycetota bacterium]